MTRTRVKAGDGKVQTKKKLDFDDHDDKIVAAKAPMTVPKVAAKAPRGSNQKRAGLHFNANRCRKLIQQRFTGKISGEAPVIMAAFLQYITTAIYESAKKAVLKEGAETRLKSSHVQMGLMDNPWLAKHRIVSGRVLGAAPIASAEHIDEEGGEEEHSDEEE